MFLQATRLGSKKKPLASYMVKNVDVISGLKGSRIARRLVSFYQRNAVKDSCCRSVLG